MNTSIRRLAGCVLPNITMNKISFVAAVLLFASLSVQAQQPNIIVIVADDYGYADLGVQGCKDIPTPHIDSIARNGTRCSSGYVSGPYCSPTRAGLLTGRYQQRFGHEFNPGPPGNAAANFGLSLNETPLPQRLKAAGYATGMVGKWHLGYAEKFLPMQRGFDEFFGFPGGAHKYHAGGGGNDAGNPIMRGNKPVEEKEYLTDAFAREAVAFIHRHKTQPFFLYLSFNAVHTPLQATDKYLKRFAHITNTQRRNYAAMTSAMDDAVGAVLKKLSDEKMDRNTLLFFISDNGGPTAANGSDNTPLRGAKSSTWEGGIRVPFLVQWQNRLPAGKVYDQPVIQLDIAPTVLAAAGVELKPEWKLDGVNLLPHLVGDKKSAPHEALYWRLGAQTAIRMGDWKLTQNGGTGKGGGAQLFHLGRDIGETTDLASKEPAQFQKLTVAWKAWSQELAEPAWKAGAAKKKK